MAMTPEIKLFGIWCKDARNNRGDWLRERSEDGGLAILAFPNQRAAQKRAAQTYGFPTYTGAKSKDWVEVRPLNGAKR